MLPSADVSSRFGLSAFFSSSRFFSAGVCGHSHYTLSCLCPVAQSVQLSPIVDPVWCVCFDIRLTLITAERCRGESQDTCSLLTAPRSAVYPYVFVCCRVHRVRLPALC